LLDSVAKLSVRLRQQQQQTISNTAAILRSGMTVMTLSLSSTVSQALIQAHKQATAAAAAPQPPPAAAAGQQAPAGTQQQQESTAAPLSAAAAAAAATGQSGRVLHGRSIDDDGVCDSGSVDEAGNWVDDPSFWPSSSGIGRDCSGSSILALLGQQQQQRPNTTSSSSSSSKPGLSVIVCESRPLNEGIVMAQRLAAAGVDVTLITDAQASVFIEESDLVLLGADAVTPAGVVNKVGSKLLALAAKAAGVPVVAVTDSLKISPGPVSAVALPNTTLQQREEEKEAEELFAGWGESMAAEVRAQWESSRRQQQKQQQQQQQQQQQKTETAAAAAALSPGHVVEPSAAAAAAAAPAGMGDGSSTSAAAGAAADGGGQGSISVRNVYFEAVPLHLVTGLVTDKGVLSQFEVSQFVKQRAAEYVQAFNLAVCADMLLTE
jgi:translation initiation factor 2B subunit (eIF-2B alpha/beta/delta family)